MSEHMKTFDYQVDGLSYTVTVSEDEDGRFVANITVLEGAMDVNAVYFGDGDMSGPSASLSGPLNMNGAGAQFEGETVQWDAAQQLRDSEGELSRPGLGRDGTDKETYITEGDTLTVELDIESLDDIEVFGIRATSTTTEEGSIKAVSGEPQEPEEPEEPTDPAYDKVFFDYGVNDEGNSLGGFSILSESSEDSVEFNIPVLPEGTEPTFENYLNYFEEIGGDVTEVETAIFYQNDDDGIPQEDFRIDAPEDGFADANELLAAYDVVLEEIEGDGDNGAADSGDLMVALSLEAPPEDGVFEEAEEDVADLETV